MPVFREPFEQNEMARVCRQSPDRGCIFFQEKDMFELPDAKATEVVEAVDRGAEGQTEQSS